MLIPDNDFSIFMIKSTMNVNSLASFIDNLGALIPEELVPSRVSMPDLEVLAGTSLSDINGSLWIGYGLDSFRFLIEDESLLFFIIHFRS